MDYNINIYSKNEDDTARFVLGNKGSNPLFVIGVNPSTADDKNPDHTIRKVMGFAEGNGFDGFVMINLYPQRSTNPHELPAESDKKLHEDNLREIELSFNGVSNPVILAAWGNAIGGRGYLKKCLQPIYELASKHNAQWKKTGELTKYGHPRHPLYVAYKWGLNDFDVEAYINRFK